jgi:hypothetical protein
MQTIGRSLLRFKLGADIALGLIMAAAVWMHVPGLNGPWYWKWPWREPRLSPAIYGLILLAAIPVLAAQWMPRRAWWQCAAALLLLMLGSYIARLSTVLVRDDMGRLDLISIIVQSPHATSYYVDAVSVSRLSFREVVTTYPDRMPGFHLHTQSKPPGPLLYWWMWIAALGDSDAATLYGGLVLGVIAVLSIPATWLMLRELLSDEPAAFAGASFLALAPGFVVFFPMFDPTYIVLSAGLIGCWHAALRTNRARYSIAVGALTTLVMLVSFSVLVIGVFMVGLVFLPSERRLAPRVGRAARHGAIAAGAALLGLLLLLAIIGYDPIATFKSAWRLQHALLAQHADERPYPTTILFDLTDFIFGAAWTGPLLAALYFAQPDTKRRRLLVVLALGQLLLVAVLALLQSETARVWDLMLPLLMIPIGLELARWPRPARAAALATLSLVLAAICQNMLFLY